MTQVKDKTDQQLNRALTELIGYKVVKDETSGNYRMMNPQGKQFGMSRPTEGLVWNDYVYQFCTDPAASLEVQAKAIEVDHGGYIQNLLIVMFGELVYEREFSNRLLDFMTAAKINNASPRERAEAAYITLQGAKGNEYRGTSL